MLNIPSGIFSTYRLAADYMVNPSGFGVSCKLVYASVASDSPSVVNPLHKNLSMRPAAVNPYRRESSHKTIETTEDITLRVYWTKKDFEKVGNVNVPDGGIMTIGDFDDLYKVQRCQALLVYTDKDHIPWRFEKLAEPFMFGLDKESSICYWRRA